MPGDRSPSGHERARRVLVVAVVAVDRLGDEVSRAPDPGFREDLLDGGTEVVRVEPDRHARAHGQFVVGDLDHRRHLGVAVVDVHFKPARAGREHARAEVVDELLPEVFRIARRPVPDEVDELLHGRNLLGEQIA